MEIFLPLWYNVIEDWLSNYGKGRIFPDRLYYIPQNNYSISYNTRYECGAKKLPEINILHISDLHCGIEADPNTQETYLARRKKTIDLFFSDFRKEIPDDWMPHIIATTGDLGWSGREYEYVRSDRTPEQIHYTVSEFLETLFAETESEQIVCCPGNHDKKQTYHLDYFQNIENPLSGNDIKELLPFFESFSSGLQKYSPCMLCNDPLFLKGSPKKQKIAKYLYGYRIFNIGETQILFIVMNSAWLCDYKRENGTDQGKLQIGVNQAQEIVRLLDDKAINAKEWPTIIMFHHPTHAWLSEMERNNPDDLSSLDRLKHLSNHIVFLHGHQHFDEDTIYATNIAGTISSRDTRDASCNILKIRTGVLPTIQKGTYKLEKDEKGTPVKWTWTVDPRIRPINQEYFFDDPKVQEMLNRGCEKVNEIAVGNETICSESEFSPEYLKRRELVEKTLSSITRRVHSLTHKVLNGYDTEDSVIQYELQEISESTKTIETNVLQTSDFDSMMAAFRDLVQVLQELDSLKKSDLKDSKEILDYLRKLKKILMKTSLSRINAEKDLSREKTLKLQID